MATKPIEYNSSHIDVRAGLEGVRTNASIYLGSTDAHGVFLSCRELMDNALDEHLAGRNKAVRLHIDSDGSYWVLDQGTGVPQGIKDIAMHINGKDIVNKLPTMQAVFGDLHTSGKYRTDAYKVAVGCFVGGTEIRLLDGTITTFESLYQAWQLDQTPIPVMTWDTKADKIAYSNISHVQLSKYTQDLVKVKIADRAVRCTPDHPFYVRTEAGIKKIQAKDLKTGMSLVSMHLKPDGDGYLWSSNLYTNQISKQNRLHRSVYQFYNPDTSIDGLDMHHENRNRQDNRASNLELSTKKAHAVEHEVERSVFSRNKMLDDPEACAEKSKLMAGLNLDPEVNEFRLEVKAIKGGMRAILAYGYLDKHTYTQSRVYSGPKWKNLKRYFDSPKQFIKQCKSWVKYHIKRSVTHKSSEDFLDSLRKHVNDQRANSLAASRSALIAGWKKTIEDIGIPISDITPKIFNDSGRGVSVVGPYGNLRRWTSLAELKSAMLESRDPAFYDDLSEVAQDERAFTAAASMRGEEGRQRIVHLFALSARRLSHIDEESYMDAKSNGTPQWKLAVACLTHTHGIHELSDIVDFVRNYNFSVISVKRYTAKEPVAVYGMTVDNQHTYFVEPGVLVANTHGIGSKGTNACAEYFDVVTFYKGKWYAVGFKAGKLTTPVHTLTKIPKGPDGTPLKLGTCIHFKPDSKIFSAKSFPPSLAVEWAEIMSYLTPGFGIIISSAKGKKVFVSQKGPIEYVTKRIEKLKAEQISPTVFEYKTDLADTVISFTNCEGSEVKGFTNGLSNTDGGTHVDSALTALYSGLCAALIKAGKEKMVQVAVKAKKGERASKKTIFKASDFKEGLVGLVNAKLHKAAFSSQNKAKLTDLRMGKDYLVLATAAATEFFTKHKSLALMLAERAAKLASLKFNFSKSKQLVSSLGLLKRKGMPIKYVPPNKSSKVCDREIFIVEGESAGGGAKDARLPFQGVLPLKGKIANAIKLSSNKKNPDGALSSEEVIHILGAIGFDAKASDPYEKLQTGKIICLADPDPDGPLAGNTRVLTLDGVRPTIESLAHNWTSLSKPFEVFSRNRKGELVIGMASNPRRVCVAPITYTLHFDNGTYAECTPKHRWVPSSSHPEQVIIEGINFVEARHLRVGDGLNSIYTTTLEGRSINSTMKYLHILNDNSLPKKNMPVHQFVKLRENRKSFARYNTANIGVVGGAIHIHHEDENSLNNTPSNLIYLSRRKHFGVHGAEMAADYNGSKKHLHDLRTFYSSKRGKAFLNIAGARISTYNTSDENRESTIALNKNPDVKRLQRLGKCSRIFKALMFNKIFTEDTFNFHAGHRCVPCWSDCLDQFGFKLIELASHNAKPLKLPKNYDKAEYPTQRIAKFKSLCEAAVFKFGYLDESRYDRIRTERGVRGDPKWESGLSWLEVSTSRQVLKKLGLANNHTITKIVINKHVNKPMYCLTVEKYGNFMIDDGLGNGICSSNCHINTLLLGLFYKYLPELYTRGMVYIAKAPEFYAIHNGNLYTEDGAQALRSKLNKAGVSTKTAINHIKGWGEVSATLIRILAMDPATRTLIQIKPLEDSDNEFRLLMDDEVATRKKLMGIDQ